MKELANPGLVTVLDSNGEDNGYWYFVMEYLSNGNLEDAVANDQVQPKDAIRITRKVLNILDCIHSHNNYVHRDIKPKNILISDKGNIKLTDFDLVSGENTTGGTYGGLGTAAYAAPEQIHDAGNADQRSDIYSVAKTCIFILCGNGPLCKELDFYGDPETIIELLQIPDGLKNVLTKAVQKRPEDRFQKTSEFLKALEEYPADTKRTKRSSRRRRKPREAKTRKQAKRYAIPKLKSKRKVEQALRMFDTEFRDLGRYRGFASNKKHNFAIEHEGRLYPVKMIISLATGRPVDTFSGGNEANDVIKSVGFNIVELHSD